MVLLTNALGLVKVSVHAQKRLRERFHINKKSTARVIRNVLNRGEVCTKNGNNSIFIVQQQYILVLEELDCGGYKIVTVCNKDTDRRN